MVVLCFLQQAFLNLLCYSHVVKNDLELLVLVPIPPWY